MVNIVFNRFMDELRKAQEQGELDWGRDIRDPTQMGRAIINRSKDETACQAADKLELIQMPKYK